MEYIKNILFEKGLLELLIFFIISIFAIYKFYRLIKFFQEGIIEVKAQLILKDTSIYSSHSPRGGTYYGLKYWLTFNLEKGEEKVFYVTRDIWDKMIENSVGILIYKSDYFIDFKTEISG